MDVEENMAARGIMKAPQKALVWQSLDSKFDSIIVWDSE